MPLPPTPPQNLFCLRIGFLGTEDEEGKQKLGLVGEIGCMYIKDRLTPLFHLFLNRLFRKLKSLISMIDFAPRPQCYAYDDTEIKKEPGSSPTAVHNLIN
jgi:hypothetical protein